MMSDNNLSDQSMSRKELINGEVVAMSSLWDYNHNRVAGQIYRVFANYLEGRSYTAIPEGLDLYLSDRDRFVPDMMVVCDRNKIEWDGVHGAPDLVVEVLDPLTMMRGRTIKFQTYQKHGVREYWIVDYGAEMIEQYLLKDGTYFLNEVYAIYHDSELEQLTPEKKAAVLAPFKCSLFDDLEINLTDIFNGLLPIV